MGGVISSSLAWESPEGHQKEASFRAQELLRVLTHTAEPLPLGALPREHYHSSLGVHTLPAWQLLQAQHSSQGQTWNDLMQ